MLLTQVNYRHRHQFRWSVQLQLLFCATHSPWFPTRHRGVYLWGARRNCSAEYVNLSQTSPSLSLWVSVWHCLWLDWFVCLLKCFDAASTLSLVSIIAPHAFSLCLYLYLSISLFYVCVCFGVSLATLHTWNGNFKLKMSAELVGLSLGWQSGWFAFNNRNTCIFAIKLGK